MGMPEFSKLSALVVDDFSSFRSTIMGMLNKLGIKVIEEAARGQDAIRLCREKKFDLILCDYNLGSGRNGQQLLEEMRYRNWITRTTMFFMVTAEASKQMVLSAYDYEPDDYLMKPLNLRVLEQRISRQVIQRKALAEVYQLLEGDDSNIVITKLESLVSLPGRHNLAAQKLLGEQYLAVSDWPKAESLYTKVLESRRLDWAVLGLAKVVERKGDPREAAAMLNQLIQESRLFLPAYDELAMLHEREGNYDLLQEDLVRVTELSPRSILRQRKLADVSSINGDVARTIRASMEAMKLGEQSCFKDVGDNLKFLEAAGNAIELNLVPENLDLADESKKCLDSVAGNHKINTDQVAQAKLLTARVFALSGKPDIAKKLAQEEENLYQSHKNRVIARDVARFHYLNTTEQYSEANDFIEEMFSHYAGDPKVLDFLDRLLPEPQNEENRKSVTKLNKLGIDAYQQGQFDEALGYFSRATILYPRHIGIQLNLLQTLVGKIKLFPDNRELQGHLQKQLHKSGILLDDPASQHYMRFEKLRDKAIQALKSTH